MAEAEAEEVAVRDTVAEDNKNSHKYLKQPKKFKAYFSVAFVLYYSRIPNLSLCVEKP